jgi:hypothetical protein
MFGLDPVIESLDNVSWAISYVWNTTFTLESLIHSIRSVFCSSIGRGRSDRGGRRGRDDRREDRRQEQVSDEEDLFANKMKNGNRQEDEEEDLFAHKMRERSPGRDREHSPMNIDTDRRHRYT